MPADFIDTNVLLYLASDDPAKADRAKALLSAGATISVQVLNEMASVARRKMGRSWEEVAALLATIRRLVDVMPLTVETHESGFRLARAHNFSVYDAMIVASALEAGCERVWSEDMQDGRIVEDRLSIRNPFRD